MPFATTYAVFASRRAYDFIHQVTIRATRPDRAALPMIAVHDGPVYMRLLRGQVPLVLDEYDYRFELGKAKLLRDGRDATIIASGFMTMRARETAGALPRTASPSACSTSRRSSRSTRRRW